ncbi:MAG: DUF3179 domain-containing (seleno)protein [Verrucomicrobia bacterium]|nr:DUF3179 domain-containing (seleno)protein [Verrucomicrobiota bacterium]
MNRLTYLMPSSLLWVLCVIFSQATTQGASREDWKIQPLLFEALTEPPCSYVSTEHRKGFVENTDKVVAWLRGAHNGGAIPLRHFLAGPRIINDTYGLFFYDPEGGYVAAYKKDYGYSFYGWRKGVMLVKSKDGTVWSALSGRALEGPQEGKTLQRIPSMTTTWGHWLMLHPESTAYNLFKGDKYPVVELPDADAWSQQHSQKTQIIANDLVMGVESEDGQMAFPLDLTRERACYNDTLNKLPVTASDPITEETSAAWIRQVGDKILTFRADDIAPETAPFMDNETNSRWTLAGRAVDGPLRGTELEWIPSIQCRAEAWMAEYPASTSFQPQTKP